jgi:acid phosphatase (class A)
MSSAFGKTHGSIQSRVLRVALAPLVAISALTACAVKAPSLAPSGATPQTMAVPTTDPAVVGEIRKEGGFLFGYLLDGLPALLVRTNVPNSLALVPPPPESGSVEQAADEAGRQAMLALRGTPRFALAKEDANLSFPASTAVFSCAMGVPITAEQTPHLAMLMRRTMTDAGAATYAAKLHYKRTRPFEAAKETSCTPKEEGTLARDGSYPSGHSAIGWAWGLVLSQVAPERSQALLERGLSYGRSRAVCGVHWMSDIAAGQTVGAATVAKLQNNADFLAQVAAAKAEVAALRASGLGPTRNCRAEAAALAFDKPASQ